MYETELILKVRVPVGCVVKTARPVEVSVFPPAALRNLVYAALGM